MNSENVVLIAIVIMATIIGIISILVIKHEKKKNAIKRSIRENCTPRRGVIRDILIESTGTRNKYLNLYVVVEDILENKLYISYGKYDYTSYFTVILNTFNKWDYDISVSGNKLNIGDKVNIYINKEIETLKMENGFINLNNMPRRYKGRKGEISDFSIEYMEHEEFANIASDMLIEDGLELILYEGFIDTNMYE